MLLVSILIFFLDRGKEIKRKNGSGQKSHITSWHTKSHMMYVKRTLMHVKRTLLLHISKRDSLKIYQIKTDMALTEFTVYSWILLSALPFSDISPLPHLSIHPFPRHSISLEVKMSRTWRRSDLEPAAAAEWEWQPWQRLLRWERFRRGRGLWWRAESSAISCRQHASTRTRQRSHRGRLVCSPGTDVWESKENKRKDFFKHNNSALIRSWNLHVLINYCAWVISAFYSKECV